MDSTHNQWKTILNTIQQGQELTPQHIQWAMEEIMEGRASDVLIAAFLMGLHTKGESSTEISSLAQGMLSKAVPINLQQDAVDIVGTGGDQLNTVNISTMSALVIAGAGVPVIKHGNRASSSSSGAADVLEKLGVNLSSTPEQVQHIFERTGIAFLFAQVFHPAMRHVAPVRKQLGVPTAFNYLGPLTNPARTTSSAIGVANERVARKIAEVFQQRKNNQALIFRGGDGLDELTITTNSVVYEVNNNQLEEYILDPREFGIQLGTIEELRGGDANHNARVFWEVLRGEAPQTIINTVLLNAAGGITSHAPVNGRSFEDRFESSLFIAKDSLENGKALAKLEGWIDASSTLADASES